MHLCGVFIYSYSALVLKLYFSRSLSLHSHLSLPQAHLMKRLKTGPAFLPAIRKF